MQVSPAWHRLWLMVAFACAASTANAISISIDYNFDGSNFFGAGNPQGAAAGLQAKTTLEAAASFYSNLLTDSFSIIQTPAPFHGAAFDGMVTWHWDADFENPATGSQVALDNMTIPANQYRIYVGARPLGGTEAGHGGPGGFNLSSDPSGGFSTAEGAQLDQIDAEFQNEVEHRDQPSGFAAWGGAIAFGSNTTWHFDKSTPPEANTTDFYSVVLHEMGHTLGLGSSDEWNSLVNQATAKFNGAASEAQYGGPVPLSPDLGHWASGTTSKIYGTMTSQLAVMVPSLLNGTSKRLTSLDAAGLTDIGWSVAAPPTLTGDYNGNGIVDAADYSFWRDTLGSTTDLRANGDNSGTSAGKIDAADFTAWKNNFGHTASGSAAAVPEPTSWMLLVLGGFVAAGNRRVTRWGCNRRQGVI
jgi:Matrixin